MIKKFTLIALIAFVAVFSACKKDEAEKNSDRLIGTWTVVSNLEIEYENGVETDREDEGADGSTIEFKSDGTGVQLYSQDSDAFKWTATDSEIKLIWNGDDEDEAEIYKIKSLSKTDMHLSTEDSYVEDGITYKEVIEVKLKKK